MFENRNNGNNAIAKPHVNNISELFQWNIYFQ